MGSPVKITVIGAGSIQFSIGLVRDLCLTPNMAGSHVTLMDINADQLQRVRTVADRYAKEVGTKLTFDTTTDPDRALAEADFVINTAGKEHMYQEERRRLHDKYRGKGIGGGLPVGYMYNLQLMLDYAKKIERICPNAWLIQSGNPVYEGTNLITRETSTKIIGLCHGHVHGVIDMAKIVGLDYDRIRWMAPGLNHTIFLNEFRYDGQDAYHLLDEWIENKAEAYWKDQVDHPDKYGLEDHMSRAVVDMYRRFGLLPIGDTTRGGGWWYKTDPETRAFWYGPLGGFGSEAHAGPWRARQQGRHDLIEAVANDPKRKVTEAFPPQHTVEQQVPIIDALANDVPGTFQINVANQGALPGVADHVVTEIPAMIDKGGIHRIQVKPLPAKIMLEVIDPLILQMEWELEAYKSGDEEMLFEGMALLHTFQSGGNCTDFEKTRQYVHDMVNEPYNADWAGHFKPRQPRWAKLVQRNNGK